MLSGLNGTDADFSGGCDAEGGDAVCFDGDGTGHLITVKQMGLHAGDQSGLFQIDEEFGVFVFYLVNSDFRRRFEF